MAFWRLLHHFAAMGVIAGLLVETSPAHAEISASPKGLIGGVLMGAELTVIGEAIVGVETEWMYLAGAGIGGAAGGVGGYFVDDSDSPGFSVALLVGGMALAIPALVLTLDATRRHWPEVEQRRLPREPSSNPPELHAGPELSLKLLPKNSRHLLRWDSASYAPSDGGLRMSLPDVYVTEAFSLNDRQRYSLPLASSIHVPVFTAIW